MRTVSATAAEKKERRVKLGALKPSDVFRFPDTSFEEAASGKDDAGFNMVTRQEPKKAGRVQIVCLTTGAVAERDDDREVIPHEAELKVHPAHTD